MSTVGRRIRRAREACGVTQEQLGKVCGTTKQTVFKYENDIVTNIPMDRIETIAQHLGVSPAYLMGWTEHSQKTIIIPDFYAELSQVESDLICKFRKLDDRGKAAVLNTLEHEYETLPGDNATATPRQA